MAEYIDRKLVLDELCRDNCERTYDGTCHNCRMTETIANFPAADVAPVVHGKVKVSEESVGAWVRVDDRIPDAEQEIILCCVTPFGYTYQCQGFYIPTGMYRDDSEYCYDLEFCEEYDEEKDDFIVNPGWYERIYNLDEYSAVRIHDKVTHWMPLNNFPK